MKGSARRLLHVVSGLAVVTLLTGCPLPLFPQFDIWLVNTTDDYVITRIVVSNEAGDSLSVLGSREIEPGLTGVIPGIQASLFLEGPLTVKVEAEEAGNSAFTVEASAEIPDGVSNGLALPLVVTGDIGLATFSFEVDYYPLDDASKAHAVMKHAAPVVEN